MKKLMMIAVSAAFMMGGLASTADAGSYPKAMKKCKACHTIEAGGKNKTGPNLAGIVGRVQGSMPGFKYGSYLKAQNAAGGTWNPCKLRAWLYASKKVAKAAGKKAKMPNQKLKGAKLDAAIEALKTL